MITFGSKKVTKKINITGYNEDKILIMNLLIRDMFIPIHKLLHPEKLHTPDPFSSRLSKFFTHSDLKMCIMSSAG